MLQPDSLWCTNCADVSSNLPLPTQTHGALRPAPAPSSAAYTRTDAALAWAVCCRAQVLLEATLLSGTGANAWFTASIKCVAALKPAASLPLTEINNKKKGCKSCLHFSLCEYPPRSITVHFVHLNAWNCCCKGRKVHLKDCSDWVLCPTAKWARKCVEDV